MNRPHRLSPPSHRAALLFRSLAIRRSSMIARRLARVGRQPSVPVAFGAASLAVMMVVTAAGGGEATS